MCGLCRGSVWFLFHNTAPDYLCELITPYTPERELRSSEKGLLVKKKAIGKTYGERAFSVCAPILWNKLPINLRNEDNLNSFKRLLKTYLFRRAYD